MMELSDEALALRFGDILFEIPELWRALRVQEIESRPVMRTGGFRLHTKGVSVQDGSKSWFGVRSPRSLE
jgi:hypothetical protein